MYIIRITLKSGKKFYVNECNNSSNSYINLVLNISNASTYKTLLEFKCSYKTFKILKPNSDPYYLYYPYTSNEIDKKSVICFEYIDTKSLSSKKFNINTDIKINKNLKFNSRDFYLLKRVKTNGIYLYDKNNRWLSGIDQETKDYEDVYKIRIKKEDITRNIDYVDCWIKRKQDTCYNPHSNEYLHMLTSNIDIQKIYLSKYPDDYVFNITKNK